LIIDNTENIRRKGCISNKSIRILHSPEQRTLIYIKYSYIEYIIQKIPVAIPVFIFDLAKKITNKTPINAAANGNIIKYEKNFNISTRIPYVGVTHKK
jgi:hypothetical protein